MRQHTQTKLAKKMGASFGDAVIGTFKTGKTETRRDRGTERVRPAEIRGILKGW